MHVTSDYATNYIPNTANSITKQYYFLTHNLWIKFHIQPEIQGNKLHWFARQLRRPTN